jgi:hypothetical protein
MIKEFYETFGVFIGAAWITCGHYRGSCSAPVLEVYTAQAIDVERRSASTAAIKEIRTAEMGGDGCVAGGARVVEVYRPTAGNGGVAGGGGVIEDDRTAELALDFGAASGAGATENYGAGARGAAEEFKGVCVASILEIDSALVVVDFARASMAIVESDRTRAQILKVGLPAVLLLNPIIPPLLR